MRVFKPILLLFFAVLIGVPSLGQQFKAIDVIIDIDWTSFYLVANQSDNTVSPVEFNSDQYVITDHLLEVLAYLSATYPEIRFSFFSGGNRQRNEGLLKKFSIYEGGPNLFEFAFRVLSFEELTEVSTDESLGFTQRYKKVVDNLIPEIDYDRTILIDDYPNFAVSPLQVVHSMGSTTYQDQYDPTKSELEWFPSNSTEWINERNKALYWLGVIEEALLASRGGKVTFAKAIVSNWGLAEDRRATNLLNSKRAAAFVQAGRQSLESFRASGAAANIGAAPAQPCVTALSI